MEMDLPNPGCDTLLRGDSPVLVVTPHTGTRLPDALREHPGWMPVEGRLADPAGRLLHEAARRCGATSISARFHPCVIDFMVSADAPALSVGVERGGLCRTRTSRGEGLYEQDRPLTAAEVDERVDHLWRPFHRAVEAEVHRLRAMHANILVLVSHASWWLSPFRAESMGRDCNVGTDNGRACDRTLVSALTETVTARGRSWVVNGNVADGFAAQHYGHPASGVHALNLEVAGQWRLDCVSQIDRAMAEPLNDPGSPASRGRGQPDADAVATMTAIIARLEGVLRVLPASADVVDSAHAVSQR